MHKHHVDEPTTVLVQTPSHVSSNGGEEVGVANNTAFPFAPVNNENVWKMIIIIDEWEIFNLFFWNYCFFEQWIIIDKALTVLFFLYYVF